MTTLDRRSDRADWRAAPPVLVLGFLAALLGAAPASAAPVASTYDSAAYIDDAAAELSSPDTVASYVRDLRAGPEGASWGRSASTRGCCVSANTSRLGPMRAGPLPETVASTFRSGSSTATELAETTTLYRAYGGDAGALGRYWSRVRPSGPLQAQIDSALNPAWGNTASEVATIRVLAGTTIYEGAAAPQPIPGGSLMGGGSQVYIPNVSPAWLVP
jgi:hypothetical protein